MIRSYRTTRVTPPRRRRYVLSRFEGVNTTVAEEKLPLRFSPKSYNFSLGKGVLAPGIGVAAGYIRKNGTSHQIKKRSTTPRFVKFYRYTMHNLTNRTEKLVGYGADGALYDYTLSAQYPTFGSIGNYGAVLSAAPYTYDGMEGLLVSTESGLYFLRDFVMTRLSFSEIFTSMCVHNDRVYATLFLDEYKLCFSDDFDPTNWNLSLSEGGYISFGTEMGRIIELKSFGGMLYVFFEHGIARLTAYNDQTEFRVGKLYLSVGTIYKGTIADCGDRIMFAASDGVFSFDGVSVQKVMTEIEELFEDGRDTAHAVCHGGKYYLACSLGMDSALSGGTNSLVVYDVWKKSFEIAHDLKVSAMAPLDVDTVSGVLADVSYPEEYLGLVEPCGKVGTTSTHKVWVSPLVTTGEETGRKILREVRVRSDTAATLLLELDGTSHTYALTEGLNKVRVMRAFDKLRFTIASDEALARITETEITVDIFGE
ncbi:MAG: hypothetical protein IJT69_00065 [Clostridia bacterium]|nr:hypothetical protein [Clostridia bacterium]